MALTATYHGDARVVARQALSPLDAMLSAVQRSHRRVGVRAVHDPVSGERRAVVQSRGDWMTVLVDDKPLISAQVVLPVIVCLADSTIKRSFDANNFSWQLGPNHAMQADEFSRHMNAITDMDSHAVLVYARSVGLVDE